MAEDGDDGLDTLASRGTSTVEELRAYASIERPMELIIKDNIESL